MNPTNVILMTRTLRHGGTERQLTEIALSLNRDLFTPHVCCVEARGFRADQLKNSRVPILEVPMSSLMGRECLSGIVRLRHYIRQHRIALMHTFDSAMNIMGAMTALLGGPIMLSSQRCYEDVIWGPYRRPVRLAHRIADGVVANCRAMERHLLTDYRVPARKIHVCYNGLDTSIFHPAPKLRPDRLSDASLVIGSISVLRPEKSLTTLLEAFARVKDIRPSMRLVIVGDGAEREALERRSTELGIGNSCVFYPGTDDVPSWLHAIDIFVLPSKSEALSNSLTEAMACECCAIASRVGGNPELVRHRETGLLFESENPEDLAEQLRLVVVDDALRSRLAKAGSEWVAANLSQESASRTMEGIYRGMLRDSQSSE
jgi:glycosyltransferase involved in cell wall biosynthesis